jgi:hypothetical protein
LRDQARIIHDFDLKGDCSWIESTSRARTGRQLSKSAAAFLMTDWYAFSVIEPIQLQWLQLTSKGDNRCTHV